MLNGDKDNIDNNSNEKEEVHDYIEDTLSRSILLDLNINPINLPDTEKLNITFNELDLFLSIFSKFFIQEVAQKIKYEEDLFDFFYEKENKIKEEIIKTFGHKKRKFFKELLYIQEKKLFDSLKNIDSTKFNIMKVLNSINIQNFNTLEEFNKFLEDKFCTFKLPKFLIQQYLIFFKCKNYIEELNSRFTQTFIKSEHLDYFIFYYNNFINKKQKIFQILKNKKNALIFLIVCNIKEFKYLIQYRRILQNNWDILCNELELLNYSYENAKEIIEKEDKNLVEYYISILNKEINNDEKNLIFLVASYHYLLINILDSPIIFSNENTKKYYTKNSMINHLLLNISNNLNKYYRNSNFVKFDITKIINIFECQMIEEKENKDTKNLKYTIKNFDDMIYLNKEHIKDIERYDLIKTKINKYRSLFSSLPTNKLLLNPLSSVIYSKSITILIPGFLSEQQNIYKWKGLLNSLPGFSMYYFYNWPAETKKSLGIKSFAYGIVIGALFKGIKIFQNTKILSKLSGKFLGFLIGNEILFKDYQINLIGFSLGCNVIKYILKEIYNCELKNKINNVVFIAGATTLYNKNNWKKIFNNTVSGRIINNFSNKDTVLGKMFAMANDNIPIGLTNLNLGEDNFYGKTIENFDFSYLNVGHTQYLDNLKTVSECWDLNDC